MCFDPLHEAVTQAGDVFFLPRCKQMAGSNEHPYSSSVSAIEGAWLGAALPRPPRVTNI
jgi:hypothetical protein